VHEDQGAAVQGRVSDSAGGQGLSWVTICGKPCVWVWVAGGGACVQGFRGKPQEGGLMKGSGATCMQ
jgi:hypothetical protein